MKKLEGILEKLINGRVDEPNKRRLPGGLYLQFKPATINAPVCRLYCYRVGVLPSGTEINVLQKALETVTGGSKIDIVSDAFNYTGSDNQTRYGFLITWQPEKKPAQLELPLSVPEVKRKGNNYG